MGAVDDFIFGTLATDALRSDHIRRLRAGVTHHFSRSPRDPSPGEAVTLDMTAGPAHPCARAWVYWTTDGSDPAGRIGGAETGSAQPVTLIGVEWDSLLWGYVQKFRAVLPGFRAGTAVRYRLSVESPDGSETFADGGTYYGFYVDDDPLPEWTREAVIYQIFVDRFNPGEGRKWRKAKKLSGFYGGRLDGITEKLDYIASLGVNTLWLTPVFPSPTHHGYDATDLFEIEKRYGTKADLKRLLEACHSRGMRVLLDFVPNHWSNKHTTFQEVLKNPESTYRDWYSFTRYPRKYESFFGVRSLPQLNLRSQGARQHLLEAARFWLEFGVDGFRLDYAIGPSPDFWADFRKETRRVKPDCWTFGEVVDPPDRQLSFDGLIDGCLDFMLLEALRQTFAFGRWEAQRFASFLDRHEAYFPEDFSRPSFLDNHDMNRFLWACNGDERRLRLAALCQFTLSGPPVVYYGTESGLSQERDIRQGGWGIPEEARQPMNWESMDAGLLEYYRGLGGLRESHPCLPRGERKLVQANEGVLAYTRQLGEDSLLVLLNLEPEAQEAEVPDGWNEVVFATSPEMLGMKVDGNRVVLPALGGIVFV